LCVSSCGSSNLREFFFCSLLPTLAGFASFTVFRH
jgi:hypothetical protein